jgi:hypothetical protein
MPHKSLIGEYVALHGGVVPRSGQRLEEMHHALEWIQLHSPMGPAAQKHLANGVSMHAFTGIFAVAKLEAAVRVGEELPVAFRNQAGWRAEGQCAWLFSDFRRHTQTVDCKGSLGLWDVAPIELEELRAWWKSTQGKVN